MVVLCGSLVLFIWPLVVGGQCEPGRFDVSRSRAPRLYLDAKMNASWAAGHVDVRVHVYARGMRACVCLHGHSNHGELKYFVRMNH